MHTLLTGGTGFIGTALCQALIEQGHQLTVLSRQHKPHTQAVKFIQNFANWTNLNAFDAVINLAGEPIFDKAWSNKQKQTLRQSRLAITSQLVELCRQSENPPHTFLSGSATGYYGNLPDFAQKYDEQTACANHFAARLCHDWEQTALQAQSPQTRVCLLRTGIVLAESGGALQRMLPLYRWGLGGKLGSGKQQWAWISLHDQIQAILFLLEHRQAQGAFNLVAPHSVSNAEFNQLLGKALHRPTFCSVPEILLKIVLGERSQLLLDNQPLVPNALLALGFQFADAHLADFLNRLKK